MKSLCWLQYHLIYYIFPRIYVSNFDAQFSIFHYSYLCFWQTEKSYNNKYKSRPAVTKQPQFHSMPLLSNAGGQTHKNREATSPNEVRDSPVKDPSSTSGGCHCICCDNFCSCTSTNGSSSSATCCYIWKTVYCPFIIKLILVALVVVLLIEFLYRRADKFVDNAIDDVRKIDVTTTTKLVKR